MRFPPCNNSVIIIALFIDSSYHPEKYSNKFGCFKFLSFSTFSIILGIFFIGFFCSIFISIHAISLPQLKSYPLYIFLNVPIPNKLSNYNLIIF